MSSVFISYRSTDREFVLPIAEHLRSHGFEVWLDQWNISGRVPYWEEIQLAVEECSHFLFVISPESVRRESGSLTELLHAVQARPAKVIVPVICKPTPPNSIPMIIGPGKFQIHDFTTLAYDEGIRRVVWALRADSLLAETTVPPASSDKQINQTEPPLIKIDADHSEYKASSTFYRRIRTISFILIAFLVVSGGVIALNSLRLNSILETPTLPVTTVDFRAAMILASTFEVQTQVANSPSKTATATPTATIFLTATPIDPNNFVAQTFAARTHQAATTIAAYTKTPTPLPTETPNYQETVAAMVAATDARSTALAVAAYTKTPVPTAINPTVTPLPAAGTIKSFVGSKSEIKFSYPNEVGWLAVDLTTRVVVSNNAGAAVSLLNNDRPRSGEMWVFVSIVDGETTTEKALTLLEGTIQQAFPDIEYSPAKISVATSGSSSRSYVFSDLASEDKRIIMFPMGKNNIGLILVNAKTDELLRFATDLNVIIATVDK